LDKRKGAKNYHNIAYIFKAQENQRFSANEVSYFYAPLNFIGDKNLCALGHGVDKEICVFAFLTKI
jgi:hypothetical protein